MGKIFRITSKFNFFVILLFAFVVGLIWAPKSWGPGLCIDVTKVCVDASGPGEPIKFNGTVTNCGQYYQLEVTVTDDHAGIVFGPEIIPPTESRTYEGSYIPTLSPSTNTVTAEGKYLTYSVTATASATCVIEDNGDEGCSPGYWRNHYEDWPATGYSPGDDFDVTFGVDLFDPDITLGDAIWMGGGGVKKLARHGTAALLNAAHPNVYYPLTLAEVIAMVQSGDPDTLAEYNELGCYLEQ